MLLHKIILNLFIFQNLKIYHFKVRQSKRKIYICGGPSCSLFSQEILLSQDSIWTLKILIVIWTLDCLRMSQTTNTKVQLVWSYYKLDDEETSLIIKMILYHKNSKNLFVYIFFSQMVLSLLTCMQAICWL